MNRQIARNRLVGCYVTVPTMFFADTLEINVNAMKRHVSFLIDGGVREGTGVLLGGGAAGDFSTMTFDERLGVAGALVEEANGRVPVAMGAQTTSTRELIRLARASERLGVDFIQVSPPFYFQHTEEDFYEYVAAASQAADIGIIVYNTYWTSVNVSLRLAERLSELPNVVGLKWSAAGHYMEFERAVTHLSDRLNVIDNHLRFVTSHMLGARGIEIHMCNYWPQWGVGLWELLEAGQYTEVQNQLTRVAMPFYELWQEMDQYIRGDGYLDKLCMELVGMDSSRCRPPTRDVREKFRERARQMLLACGVPGVQEPSRFR